MLWRSVSDQSYGGLSTVTAGPGTCRHVRGGRARTGRRVPGTYRVVLWLGAAQHRHGVIVVVVVVGVASGLVGSGAGWDGRDWEVRPGDASQVGLRYLSPHGSRSRCRRLHQCLGVERRLGGGGGGERKWKIRRGRHGGKTIDRRGDSGTICRAADVNTVVHCRHLQERVATSCGVCKTQQEQTHSQLRNREEMPCPSRAQGRGWQSPSPSRWARSPSPIRMPCNVSL